ncbi:zinc-ribbon domain containing protein [Prosthecobacter sp.]|uniref:zinc-ribbon domain containing protein n=1 Tax=Prosthecobacter sp. TaxID=1965333 RepID=UPI00378393D8
MSKGRRNQSNQRLRKVIDERERRIRLLLERGLIQDASEIPDDSIPVDPDLVLPTNACIPAVCYMDIEFRCADCGKPDFWSAGSQQHYYEILKASPYKRPKRCYECRQKELARKQQARADSGHEAT